jgi:hypothetical protein
MLRRWQGIHRILYGLDSKSLTGRHKTARSLAACPCSKKCQTENQSSLFLFSAKQSNNGCFKSKNMPTYRHRLLCLADLFYYTTTRLVLVSLWFVPRWGRIFSSPTMAQSNGKTLFLSVSISYSLDLIYLVTLRCYSFSSLAANQPIPGGIRSHNPLECLRT